MLSMYVTVSLILLHVLHCSCQETRSSSLLFSVVVVVVVVVVSAKVFTILWRGVLESFEELV